MGNQQQSGGGKDIQRAADSPSNASNETTNLVAVIRRSAKAKNARLQMQQLMESRRRSMGQIVGSAEQEREAERGGLPHANHQHQHHCSFTFGQSPTASLDTGGTVGSPNSSADGILSSSSSQQLSGNNCAKLTQPPMVKRPPRIEVTNGEGGQGRTAEQQQEGEKNTGAILPPSLAPGGTQRQTQSSDGRRSSGSSLLPFYSKHRAHKVDSRKIVARKRLERGKTAASGNGTGPTLLRARDSPLALSLDIPSAKYNPDICAEMRPLHPRTLSQSPLLHQRRLFGSLGSGGLGIGPRSSFSVGEEGILSREQADAVQQSWRRAKQRIEQFAGPDRCFGFFAFDRIFERAPELKPLFGLSPGLSLIDLDSTEPGHSFIRHSRTFNSILELAVRNAFELETEMLPALFTYGQRHYRPKIIEQFNERTVRLFCSQVVGTMCDLLDDELSPLAVEAWVEMITYLGRALISGFEHERRGKRGSQHKIL